MTMLDRALSLLSFAFNRSLFWLFRRAVARKARRELGGTAAKRWKPISESFGLPAFLPIVSVLGPRWNCHAGIAGIGPLRVERTLSCQVGELQRDAESFTIVLYDADSQTLDWSGSTRTDSNEIGWQLPPGEYSLVLRYYTSRDALVVPEVSVDGTALEAGRVIPGELSRYFALLESIRSKTGLYYRCLHYFIFHHLRRAEPSRADWVRRHFIPVGNPDTDWRYGYLAAGERLHVSFDEQRSQHLHTYVAFYNTASFPVHWCRLQQSSWSSPPFEHAVAYAIRRVKIAREPAELPELRCAHIT